MAKYHGLVYGPTYKKNGKLYKDVICQKDKNSLVWDEEKKYFKCPECQDIYLENANG